MPRGSGRTLGAGTGGTERCCALDRDTNKNTLEEPEGPFAAGTSSATEVLKGMLDAKLKKSKNNGHAQLDDLGLRRSP